jgi:HEAT repeat protein
MSEPDKPPTPDRLTALLEEGDHEETVECLDRLGAADAETRKRVLRVVRDVAEEPSPSFEELAGALSTFLTDEDRAVRLTTAKLFVTLGQSEPGAVLPAVSSLAGRLADDEEFYYVRARSAEALGYVALEYPNAVNDPGILADFRIGLSFDEPEVKEKLAKALEYVALGDPDRLRHQVSSLVAHLDDGNELVRYHLCTMLVAVGCAHPAKLTDARVALTERLTDESPYVRGRAAEALGLLTRSESDDAVPAVDEVEPGEDDAQAFVTERVQFARDRDDERYEKVGTIESIRHGTDEIVEAINSPDGDGACPHCGLELPEAGPPMCPRCSAPR